MDEKAFYVLIFIYSAFFNYNLNYNLLTIRLETVYVEYSILNTKRHYDLNVKMLNYYIYSYK